MPRYNRQLGKEAFDYLLTTGSFIIPEIKSARPQGAPFTLDIQLRENDELMVYMGCTCLFILKIDTSGKRLIFSADKSYSDAFLGSYLFNQPPIGEIAAYLKRTFPKVNNRWFGNKKEGYYQNLLCYLHGENSSNSNSPFIIFDRECVVGFSDEPEKRKFFDPIAQKYEAIRHELQKSNSQRFGIPNGKRFGNELDLLAIDKETNLHCIELKFGDNGSGIYWAPLQVAVYKELVGTLEPSYLFSNIKELVKQKTDLSLLPQEAYLYFKDKSSFNKVLPSIAVAKPNDNMNCWGMMKEIINANKQDLNCGVYNVDERGNLSEKR